MEWISVTEEIPDTCRIVEVRLSGGGTFRAKLIATPDECAWDGRRMDWVYRSGLHACSLDETDQWREAINAVVPQ